MTAYQKPELCALGNATLVIQGSKDRIPLETDPTKRQPKPDCEMDD